MPSQSIPFALAVCALLLAAPDARAADLAAQSRLGAIFAEPTVRAPPPRLSREHRTNVFVTEAIYAFQPRIPGYYGRAGDFAYHNYYGTAPLVIFGRDPYACTLLSQC